MITPSSLAVFRVVSRLMDRRTPPAAGVPCEVEVVQGAFHGFDGVVPKAPVSQALFASQVAWLRRNLTQRESAQA